MDSEVIDQPDLTDEFDSSEIKNRKSRVRIISGILFLLILTLSAFCNKEIMQVIHYYCQLRSKLILGFAIQRIISSLFLSSSPIIAYNVWLKSRTITVSGYFAFFVCTTLLYGVLFVLGFELTFELSHKASDDNPLLPSYILSPPVYFVFNLLFIFSAVVSFLMLKFIFRKKIRKPMN